MRTLARRNRPALAVALLALAAWGAGWSLHAGHPLREALGGGPAEICTALGARSAPGDETPGPRHEAQCAICAQFLSAAAPQQSLAAPAGLLGIATHEAAAPHVPLLRSHAPRLTAGARAPPAAA